jgi:hypothetical protein
MIRVLFCLLISLLTLSAAEVSGKWTGSIQVKTSSGEMMTVPLMAELHQKGQKLVGTVGRYATEKQAVQNGKVEGTKVSFEVTSADSGIPFKFALTLNDTHLDGEMKGQLEDGPISGKVALTRGE